MNRADLDSNAACAEYESRILDAVVDGLDARTLAHLRTCPRCARAAREIDGVADLARAALLAAPKPTRRFALPLVKVGTLVAALVLLGGMLLLDRFGNEATVFAEPHRLLVLPAIGAVVEQTDSLHARIRAGESTFVFADSRPSVETPFGSLRCTGGCEFTVHIENDECGLAMPLVDSNATIKSLLGVKMTILVASGEVASLSNGRSDILSKAHRLTLPFDHDL